jgi:hypothetical protein
VDLLATLDRKRWTPPRFRPNVTRRPLTRERAVDLEQRLALAGAERVVGADRLDDRGRLGLGIVVGPSPACSRSASAELDNDAAMASRTRSEGSRSPRSICDRYGFEIPARSANWRIDSSLSSRWRRMISPRRAARSPSAIDVDPRARKGIPSEHG